MLTNGGPIQLQRNNVNYNSIINAVPFRTFEPALKQADRQNAVIKSDKISRTEWRQGLSLREESSAYREKFINVLTQFESMCDGHLGSIEAVPHQIELKKTDTQPV